jgi:hypothetical protein
MKEPASVMQSKTQRPVQFEITGQTRKSVQRWIERPTMSGSDDLWPSRLRDSPHLSTRQYAGILRGWMTSIGLEPSTYGTQSARRTKAAQIYKKTGNCSWQGRSPICQYRTWMPPSSWFQRNHFGTFDAVGWGHPLNQFIACADPREVLSPSAIARGSTATI